MLPATVTAVPPIFGVKPGQRLNLVLPWKKGLADVSSFYVGPNPADSATAWAPYRKPHIPPGTQLLVLQFTVEKLTGLDSPATGTGPGTITVQATDTSNNVTTIPVVPIDTEPCSD